MNSAAQVEFVFSSQAAVPDGLLSWRETRAKQMNELARKLGLPIGHPVEVWLAGGIRLKGVLRLIEETLLVPDPRDAGLRLEVQNVSFNLAEMESCVRQD